MPEQLKPGARWIEPERGGKVWYVDHVTPSAVCLNGTGGNWRVTKECLREYFPWFGLVFLGGCIHPADRCDRIEVGHNPNWCGECEAWDLGDCDCGGYGAVYLDGMLQCRLCGEQVSNTEVGPQLQPTVRLQLST